MFDPLTGEIKRKVPRLTIFPKTHYVTPREKVLNTIDAIKDELKVRIKYFEDHQKLVEAQRIQQRTLFDLEMMVELGYCSGIENYSRYFDGRAPGARPFCLLDYFPKDYMMVIDESHVTLPQIRGMYSGDRSRKETLVEYGFRLPAALDNRPLKFDEFEAMERQVIYMSATPAEFELAKCEGIVVEQLIRPTGLLDPIIEVRPTLNQIDDLLEEIRKITAKDERVIITTLTKRMAEELTKYLSKVDVRCRYIHSEVDTLERVEILRDLRLGLFDVLIGVNLLREGIDLPEVSLLAILDADKEGFLRSDRSLTQIVGRVARNSNGRVIMYGDKITGSMQRTIDETLRRRKKQIEYNFRHNITPVTIFKSKEAIMEQSMLIDGNKGRAAAIPKVYMENKNATTLAAEPSVGYSDAGLEDKVKRLRKEIEKAAKELDFLEAARLKDQLLPLQKALEERKKK